MNNLKDVCPDEAVNDNEGTQDSTLVPILCIDYNLYLSDVNVFVYCNCINLIACFGKSSNISIGRDGNCSKKVSRYWKVNVLKRITMIILSQISINSKILNCMN